MSNTRCEIFNTMLIPTLLSVAVFILTQWAALEMFLLYALCIGLTLAHLHYGTCVVSIYIYIYFTVNC